jgi:hypothetical protein
MAPPAASPFGIASLNAPAILATVRFSAFHEAMRRAFASFAWINSEADRRIQVTDA